MKLTKYGHACFMVERDGTSLIVDPGEFTHDLGAPENVAVIVITHEHPDHFDPAAVKALAAHNPAAKVVAHESILKKLGSGPIGAPVRIGETLDIGSFSLTFYGGEHAVIHGKMPTPPNLGVVINDSLYYPGDSFALPDQAITTLALPIAAPWCKISEVIDFLQAIKPRLAFPTHDAILSDAGKAIADNLIRGAIVDQAITYRRLNEPTDI